LKRESERRLEENIENLVIGGMGLNDFLFIPGFATALSSFGLNAVLRSAE
jgi:hypothetical protein